MTVVSPSFSTVMLFGELVQLAAIAATTAAATEAAAEETEAAADTEAADASGEEGASAELTKDEITLTVWHIAIDEKRHQTVTNAMNRFMDIYSLAEMIG